MSKQPVTAFVHYEQDYKGKPLFSVYPFDMSSTGKVLVGEQTLEVDVPADFDPIASQVSLLKKEREKVRAELSKRLMELDDAISKLTCIEHTVEA